MHVFIRCIRQAIALAGVAALGSVGALLLPAPVGASHKPCDCLEQICSSQGFEIKLEAFEVDTDAGTSSWTYKVCNQALGSKICSPGVCSSGGKTGFGCTTSADCPGGSCDLTGGGGSGATGDSCTTSADCSGACVPCAPPKDLSHVDIVLPGLGECVNPEQTKTITQIEVSSAVVCSNSLSNRDASCPAELCAPRTGGKFCDANSGPNTGDACQINSDCRPSGFSSGRCESVECQGISAICTGAGNHEEPCTVDTDCPVPATGACTPLTGNCSGGPTPGISCTTDADCNVGGSGGTCTKLEVLKCDVAGLCIGGTNDGNACDTKEAETTCPGGTCTQTNLDAGECLTIKIEIAGEIPTLGPGTIDVVTKAATECEPNQICGPACACEQQPPDGDECLTRTRGFWGTHPHITSQFLPITVCGETLTTTTAGTCDSVTEAVCSNSSEAGKGNQAYVQLVAQLAAAKLNQAASAANDGGCGSSRVCLGGTNSGTACTADSDCTGGGECETISDVIASCEGQCSSDQATISGSGCIEALDGFNNSQDTFAVTPSPFDRPGPADPSQCRDARGNKLVIGMDTSSIVIVKKNQPVVTGMDCSAD